MDVDVLFLDAGQFGVDDEGVRLLGDVHADRRGRRRRVHVDGTDEKAAEQIVERIETGEMTHDFLL